MEWCAGCFSWVGILCPVLFDTKSKKHKRLKKTVKHFFKTFKNLQKPKNLKTFSKNVGFSNPDIPTYVTTVVMVPIDVARYAALGHVPPTSIIN